MFDVAVLDGFVQMTDSECRRTVPVTGGRADASVDYGIRLTFLDLGLESPDRIDRYLVDGTGHSYGRSGPVEFQAGSRKLARRHDNESELNEQHVLSIIYRRDGTDGGVDVEKDRQGWFRPLWCKQMSHIYFSLYEYLSSSKREDVEKGWVCENLTTRLGRNLRIRIGLRNKGGSVWRSGD